MTEVFTDERGRPQAVVDRVIEDVLADAVARGDLQSEHVDGKRLALRAYAEATGRRGVGDDAYLDYLGKMRFACDVDAIPEGTVVFPNEPLVR